MDGGSGLWPGGVGEHIDSTSVPIDPARLPSRFNHRREMRTINSSVNIGGEPGAERIAFKDVDENGHSTHHSVWYARGSQQRVELMDSVEQLFHMSVIG
jgi:hypothetical protein